MQQVPGVILLLHRLVQVVQVRVRQVPQDRDSEVFMLPRVRVVPVLFRMDNEVYADRVFLLECMPTVVPDRVNGLLQVVL